MSKKLKNVLVYGMGIGLRKTHLSKIQEELDDIKSNPQDATQYMQEKKRFVEEKLIELEKYESFIKYAPPGGLLASYGIMKTGILLSGGLVFNPIYDILLLSLIGIEYLLGKYFLNNRKKNLLRVRKEYESILEELPKFNEDEIKKKLNQLESEKFCWV